MADTKISDLTPVTDIQLTDLYVLARGSTNNSIDGASLLAGLGGGGGGGGATVVYDHTLVADAANFDVSLIPDSFTAIGYSLTGRGDTAATEVGVRLRMNADSGNNYEYQRFFSHSGNNNSGSDGSAQSSMYVGEIPAASATAARSGTCEGEIHGYADTTFDKIVLAQAGRVAAIHIVEVMTGSWLSTAAIDQLTFFPTSGDFLAGTRLTIYGYGSTSDGLVFGETKLTSGDLTGLASTSFADLTGATVTVTTEARRARVTCILTYEGQALGAQLMCDLAIDGTRQGGSNGLTWTGTESSSRVPMGFSYITDVLTAGSHTFKLQYRVGSDSLKVYASSTAPLILQVEELPFAT